MNKVDLGYWSSYDERCLRHYLCIENLTGLKAQHCVEAVGCCGLGVVVACLEGQTQFYLA